MNKIFTALIFFLVVSAIAVTFTQFFKNKQYEFFIETGCDPLAEICFIRDCTNPDDCPPNQLEVYKMYTITASDFESCKDNSCEMECINQTIQCIPIACGESDEDVCSTRNE